MSKQVLDTLYDHKGEIVIRLKPDDMCDWLKTNELRGKGYGIRRFNYEFVVSVNEYLNHHDRTHSS